MAGPGVNLVDIPNICGNFDIDDEIEEVDKESPTAEESEEESPKATSGEPMDSTEDEPISAPVLVDLTEQLRQLDEVTKSPSKKGKKAAAKKTPKAKKLTKAQQKKLERQQIQNALSRIRAAVRNVTSPRAGTLPLQASTSTPTSAVNIVNEIAINNNENKKGNRKSKQATGVAPTRSSPRFSTRRRRNFLGTDDSSQTNNIEVIDLVKSPPLVLPGVVSPQLN